MGPPAEREQEVEAADAADADRPLLPNAAATPGGDHGINSEPSRHAAAAVDADDADGRGHGDHRPLYGGGEGGGGGGGGGGGQGGQDAHEEQGGGLELSRTLTFMDGIGVIIGIMVGVAEG